MESRSARLLRKGDILERDGEQQVVRSVSVVVELANGEVLGLDTGETVEVHGQEDLSELIPAVDELTEEEKQREKEIERRQRALEKREKKRKEREEALAEQEAVLAEESESNPT